MTAESESARNRRLQHERQLERVGIHSDAGQRLLERWAAEARAARRKAAA